MGLFNREGPSREEPKETVVAECEPDTLQGALKSFEADETIPAWFREEAGAYMNSFDDASKDGLLKDFTITEKGGAYKVEVGLTIKTGSEGFKRTSTYRIFREASFE